MTNLGTGSLSYVDDNNGWPCTWSNNDYSMPPGYGHYYHVVTTSGTSDTSVQYQQAIEGTDSGANKTPVEKITGPGYVGTHWSFSGGDRAAVFSSDPSGGGMTLPITYSFGAAGSTDTHIVANLAPNATVNVSRTKNAGTVSVTLAASGGGTNLTASSSGLVCFDSSLTPCSSSKVTSASSCDLNNDGLTNILDVQISVNQTLGVVSCSNGDLNGDGICSIVDTQRVINAAMGQTCKIGP